MNREEADDKKSILILEDNFLLAKCFAQVVENLVSFEVVVAYNNASAIAILESSDVVAAFIDIRLEFESSEKTAQALLKRNIPFVFVSGQPLSNEIKRSFPNADVLIKPARKEQINKKLEKLI